MRKDAKDPDGLTCVETQCKHKQERLNLCEKHFDEFKFGVIRKDGTRPVDYDRKMLQYERHRKGV